MHVIAQEQTILALGVKFLFVLQVVKTGEYVELETNAIGNLFLV